MPWGREFEQKLSAELKCPAYARPSPPPPPPQQLSIDRCITFKRFLQFLESLCTAVRYLFVTQCGRSILGVGVGRSVF